MVRLNLANILTLSRLALLPFIVMFLFLPWEGAAWAALVLYTIGAITDWMDGWAARRFGQVSEFGKLVDPIADKIFVAVILLMLVEIGRISNVWVLTVIIILVREFIVSGLREFLGPKNISLPVTDLAKWKTATQMIAIGVLIVGPYIPLGILAGTILLCIAAVLTIITGWGYIKTALADVS